MYESYSWPGAYSFKEEISLFVGWFKEFFSGTLKRIEETEKKI